MIKMTRSNLRRIASICMLCVSFFAIESIIVVSQDDAHDFMPVWSPDGEYIANISNRDGEPDLWVMRNDGSDATNLTSTFDSFFLIFPSWSPDSESIAFMVQGEDESFIWLVELHDLSFQNLTEDISSRAGGQPAWSPDGEFIAFVVANADSTSSVWVIELETNEYLSTDLALDSAFPRWSPNGSLFFTSYSQAGSSLNRYDIASGESETLHVGKGFEYTISPEGETLAYFTSQYNQPVMHDIVLYSIQGNSELMRVSDPRLFLVSEMAWSPDSSKIAFRSICDFELSKSSIWIFELDNFTLNEVTDCDFGSSTSPTWSPDNETIAFQAIIDDESDIWTLNLNTGELTNLTASD